MARKKPTKTIARKRAKVKKKQQSKKRVTSHTRKAKKKRGKKPQPKKPSKKKPIPKKRAKKKAPVKPIKRHPPRKVPPKPPSRKKAVPVEIPKTVFEAIDVEMMTEQVIERIKEKIIIPGHWKEVVETKILSALIAAEQAGTFDEAAYEMAEEYEWEPNEVYSLWMSP